MAQVYADVDALVDDFYAAVDVKMPFHQRGVSGSDKGRQPFDQLLAFPHGMHFTTLPNMFVFGTRPLLLTSLRSGARESTTMLHSLTRQRSWFG